MYIDATRTRYTASCLLMPRDMYYDILPPEP